MLRKQLIFDGGVVLMEKDVENTWKLSLIYSEDKSDAICIHIAMAFSISPKRYNEIAVVINQIIDSTAGPAEFWKVINERLGKMFLNDVESVLFGAMVSDVISKIPDSVYFGRKLAEIVDVDYDKIVSYRNG